MSSRLTQRLDFCFKEQSISMKKLLCSNDDGIILTVLTSGSEQARDCDTEKEERWGESFFIMPKNLNQVGFFVCQRWEVMFKSFCRWSTSRIDCSGWLLDCSHSILSAFRGCHFYCVCRSSPFYVFTTLPSFILMNRTFWSNYYFRDCLNNKEDVIGGGQFGCQDGQLFKEGIVCMYTM